MIPIVGPSGRLGLADRPVPAPGGSFANKASAVQSAPRFRYDEDVRYYANGFRLVRNLLK
jgi:hypothetical protein